MWWSASWSAPGNQGPAGRGHRERDVSRRASGCDGRDTHHEVAQNARHDRLRPPGLAIRRTPRRVLFPSVRLDGPPLGIVGDRPPQRPRLGVSEGMRSYGLRHLTRLRSPAAPGFICLRHGGPTIKRGKHSHAGTPPTSSSPGIAPNPDCRSTRPLSPAIESIWNRVNLRRARSMADSRPVRRLAHEAADSGLLTPDLAAGIRRVKGPKNLGVYLGNWLTADQAKALWRLPDPSTLKGKRDRALLAVLVGCGLRRKEAAETGPRTSSTP
jgi:hypothetical protein